MIVLILLHKSLATHSQVINTTGLCNDYTFRSGLQPKKFDLFHQTVFLVRGGVWARD